LSGTTEKLFHGHGSFAPGLAIFAVALSAIRLGATSADGVALAMLPPMVARFLIWIDPTSAALWAKGYLFLMIGEVSMAYMVVSAPMVIVPSLFSRTRLVQVPV
jgi:hypothetical protein